MPRNQGAGTAPNQGAGNAPIQGPASTQARSRHRPRAEGPVIAALAALAALPVQKTESRRNLFFPATFRHSLFVNLFFGSYVFSSISLFF